MRTLDFSTLAFFTLRLQPLVWLLCGFLFSLTLMGCQQSSTYDEIHGQTMGTTYRLHFQTDQANAQQVQDAVEERLAQINHSMSTYQEDSLISRFNRAPADEWFAIDEDFAVVYNDARTVYVASKGALDPTVMPLVDLWGFGPTRTVERLQNPPTAAQIQQAKAQVGFDAVVVDAMRIQKTRADVALDFSAVAKGHAVDALADLLEANFSSSNYFIDIGGEVATKGVNPHGNPWQIAIDVPAEQATRTAITVLRQPSQASLRMATSGDYRNLLVFDGKQYSHTIDPTTGSPIVGGAPSVTVVADTVSLADAWATALMAMPYDQALTLANDLDLAVLFVIPDAQNWQVVTTEAMRIYLP